MSWKTAFKKGFREGTEASKWLLIFNAYAWFCFGVLAIALIIIEPASWVGLLIIGGSNFCFAAFLVFILKKMKVCRG